jgi:hypothetical protein
MTTLGDIIFENATPVPDRLAGNITATRMFLRQTGTGAISAAPAWDTLQASDIPALSYLAAVTSDAPLTGSGTAGSHLTFSVQNATKVFAGPTFGNPDAVPTFRALIATDIPALAYIAAITSDSPLTGSGTAGSHLTFSAQTAAYVFAGPATGGAVVPTFRALVATDIPALAYLSGVTADTPLSGAGTSGSHLVISAVDSTHAGYVPVSGTPAARNFLRAAATTGAVAWDTLTSSDVGLSAVTNDAQTKASIVPNTAPAAGQILVGNAGGTAYAPQTMGTDATLASTGALTIANGAVTLAKMADMATASLFYRKTAGNGAPEVNTLATLKTDLGLTGTNSGDQTITLTGDVTGSGTGSFAATIGANKVTLAMMAPIANNTVLGNTSGGAAVPSALTALAGLTAYGIRDTSAAFDVQLGATSSVTLTGNCALTFDVTNAARTIRLTGNPTLADWFDQNVTTTGSPQFKSLGIGQPFSSGTAISITAAHPRVISTSNPGTNEIAFQFINSAGTCYFGTNDSAGLNFGGTPYAFVFYTDHAIPIECTTNNVLRMRIGAAGGVEIVNGALTTGAPTGGTAGAWKLGIWVNTPTVPTGYIQLDVGGTLYEIAAKVH